METLENLVEQYQSKSKSKSEIISRLEDLLADESISQMELNETLHSLLENNKISPGMFDELENLLQSLSGKTVIASSNTLPDSAVTEIDQHNNAQTRVIAASDTILSSNGSTIVKNPEKTRLFDTEKTLASEIPVSNHTRHIASGFNPTAVNPELPSKSTGSYNARENEEKATQVKTGSVIKERFILKEVIGAGGMSIVFKALDLRKQEAKNKNPYVAIKVLGDIFKNQLQSLLVLERESQQIQKLAHPNIVTVYDFDRDGDIIYMTMECLEGKSLDQIIAKNKLGMPYIEAVKYVEGMCRGLAYAHSKQIIHSDFKPENVFYTKDKVVKILDFGIARAKKKPDVTEVQDEFDAGSLGALTPPYASCEMFENLDPDPRDDIYALGCVIYKLLTGEHPFDGMPSVKARDKKLKPKRINQLTKRQWRTLEAALSFERSTRIPTVVEFLNGFLPRKISPWFYATGAALLLTLSVGGYSWFFVSTQPEMPQIILTEDQKNTITNALETADAYLSMGYLASPPGDSALDQYDKILSIDPTNQFAIDGKKAIAEKYLELAKAEMESGNYDQSMTLLRTGLIVEPDKQELKLLEQKVSELRAKN